MDPRLRGDDGNTEKGVKALSVMTSSTVILVLGRLVRVTDDEEEQA